MSATKLKIRQTNLKYYWSICAPGVFFYYITQIIISVLMYFLSPPVLINASGALLTSQPIILIFIFSQVSTITTGKLIPMLIRFTKRWHFFFQEEASLWVWKNCRLLPKIQLYLRQKHILFLP